MGGYFAAGGASIQKTFVLSLFAPDKRRRRAGGANNREIKTAGFEREQIDLRPIATYAHPSRLRAVTWERNHLGARPRTAPLYTGRNPLLQPYVDLRPVRPHLSHKCARPMGVETECKWTGNPPK